MTKEIQFDSCTMSESELKALMVEVERLEELDTKKTYFHQITLINHEINEMYDPQTKTWLVQVKMI